MKSAFFISILGFSFFTNAQDSSCCYNSGLPSSITEVTATSIENKPFYPLILMPYVMGKKEIVSLLKEKKNSSLEKLLTKSKAANRLRLVGFAAIPAGIMGSLSIVEANKKNTSQNGGLGLLALGAVSLSSSIYFNHETKKNYKKAIAKYNQVYN